MSGIFWLFLRKYCCIVLALLLRVLKIISNVAFKINFTFCWLVHVVLILFLLLFWVFLFIKRFIIFILSLISWNLLSFATWYHGWDLRQRLKFYVALIGGFLNIIWLIVLHFFDFRCQCLVMLHLLLQLSCMRLYSCYLLLYRLLTTKITRLLILSIIFRSILFCLIRTFLWIFLHLHIILNHHRCILFLLLQAVITFLHFLYLLPLPQLSLTLPLILRLLLLKQLYPLLGLPQIFLSYPDLLLLGLNHPLLIFLLLLLCLASLLQLR